MAVTSGIGAIVGAADLAASPRLYSARGENHSDRLEEPGGRTARRDPRDRGTRRGERRGRRPLRPRRRLLRDRDARRAGGRDGEWIPGRQRQGGPLLPEGDRPRPLHAPRRRRPPYVRRRRRQRLPCSGALESDRMGTPRGTRRRARRGSANRRRQAVGQPGRSGRRRPREADPRVPSPLPCGARLLPLSRSPARRIRHAPCPGQPGRHGLRLRRRPPPHHRRHARRRAGDRRQGLRPLRDHRGRSATTPATTAPTAAPT